MNISRALRFIALFVGGLCFAYGNVTAEETESLVVNGDLLAWTDGVPDDWTVGVGAKNGGERPGSEVEAIDGGGVVLRGTATTMAWHNLSQDLALEGGKTYAVSFEARSKGVRREGRQYDNCYVGLMSFDAAGERVEMAIQDVSRVPRWKRHRVNYAVPRNAARTQLLVFLSKSGELAVKNVRVVEATAGDAFAELTESLMRNYSFSALKAIDWRRFTDRFRADAEAAESPEAFADVIGEMLGELEDLHVWIELPGGKRRRPYIRPYRGNYDFDAVRAKLESLEQFGEVGFTGQTAGGIGVVVVQGLPAGQGDVYKRLIASVQKMFDAAGILVDLRANKGGAEGRAAEIAGLFADREYVYALSKFRNGPEPNDFGDAIPRRIGPRVEAPYGGPVVCLVGPGCVSSGEGFAMMMKAMERVTLVGQPTRGASGNPAAVTLSNGVKVWFSRWVAMEPDGTEIEGKGVAPDELVEHVKGGEGDVTFERGVEMLRRAQP